MIFSTRLAGCWCGVAAAVLAVLAVTGGGSLPGVATAMAATPAPKVTMVVVGGQAGPESPGSFSEAGASFMSSVRCPPGTHFLGGGAEVQGGYFDSMLATPNAEPKTQSEFSWDLGIRMRVWYPNIAKFVTNSICESDTW